MVNKYKEHQIKVQQGNILYQRIINEKGRQHLIEELTKSFKQNELELVKDSYTTFIRDLKFYPKSVNNIPFELKGCLDTVNQNLNKIPIFEVLPDEKDYSDTDFPIIPFRRFFIATHIFKEIQEELFSINGFHVMEFGKDFLMATFIWSRVIDDGWKAEYLIINKRGLATPYDKSRTAVDNLNSDCDVKDFELRKKILHFATEQFYNLMRKIMDKLKKHEYREYKFYDGSKMVANEITYSSETSAHKRHFWKDSGRFKIPLMSKDELKLKGYGIDKLVFRGIELRKNVPFRFIGEMIKNIDKKNKRQREINLIKKRILRQEEKIYKILREIYPDKVIRRHDRKTLKGLELDFNIPELRLGIEYDGEQHFDEELYNKLYGDGFEAQVRRDRQKDKLCRRKKIKLIRIKYDESLTKTNVKKLISN